MPEAIARLPEHVQPVALEAFKALTLSSLTRVEIANVISAIKDACTAIPVIQIEE